MSFISLHYAFFLISVLLVYWKLSRRYQHLLLLVASYTFYGFWDWRFLSLICLTSCIDYFVGHKIHMASSQRTARLWLSTSLVINLGILAYFKYAGFFLDSLVSLLTQLGIETHFGTLSIILPVGISFYTFQSISYSIDIYRKELKPSNSLLDFLTFVAFFPQLVAGPIVRAREFMYQMSEKRIFNWDDAVAGLQRILTGIVKKAVIADTLAIQIVDPVFANPENYDTSTLWLAALAYAVQIYCDFSGYSNIAIGSARLFGFHLPENFRFPYLSTSFSEFWTRWHITMSRMFRDYVYIPLGGNRRSPPRNLANLATTTLVSGLWHGAAWQFALWGGLHGVLLVIQRLVPQSIRNLGQASNTAFARTQRYTTKIVQFFTVQFCILLTWVFFRALNMDIAEIYFTGLFSNQTGIDLNLSLAAWFCFTLFAIDHAYGARAQTHEKIMKNPIIRVIFWLSLIMIAHHGMPEGENPFIYFQF